MQKQVGRIYEFLNVCFKVEEVVTWHSSYFVGELVNDFCFQLVMAGLPPSVLFLLL